MSVELLGCPNASAHCWHARREIHAVYVEGGVHLDEICCFCGQTRCRNEVMGGGATGHGPYSNGPTLKFLGPPEIL